MSKCRECNKGKLKILGTGDYGDTIMVECRNKDCGEIYEVESDGLGECGMEWVEAKMMDIKKEEIKDEALQAQTDVDD
jgi:hypothetical protein